MGSQHTEIAADIAEIFTALIDTVEELTGGLTGRHVRIMLASAACRAGDPSEPRSHDHGRCRATTGRRIAEALWAILDEVQFNGPWPNDQITTALTALHDALRTESKLRRPPARS